jgi:acetyltransferase-like isoleucine patch superfamily enzyme
MDGNMLYHKIDFKIAKLFTLLLKRSFKAFGKGSLIFFPNRIDNPDQIEIGEKVFIYSGCWLNALKQHAGRPYHGVISIGDHTLISHGVQITSSKRIVIGRNVGLGKNAVIADHIHEYRHVDQAIVYAPVSEGRPIEIQDDAAIMPNSVIAHGVTIGVHAFIGAGSLVLQDIPPFCMAAGNPARVVQEYDAVSRQWRKVV